jgi:hypothetical protein
MRRGIRTLAIGAIACLSSGAPATAQTMTDAFGELFVFGTGGDPLFLAGSAGVSSTQVHGEHFIPSQAAGNGALLEFLTSAIAINVSSFPLPSTTSSQTFRFVDGVPTPTSNSFGPIVSERVQTVGRGRLNAGMNYSRQTFKTLRGTRLSDLELAFTHVDVDFDGCDEAVGGDCSEFGIPQVENDVIDLALDLGIDAEVYAFFATFGLTDRIDFSLAVPVVSLSLVGTSTATVNASTTDQALHFFGGTPENPVLQAESAVRNSTSGLGDVAVRLKGQVTDNPIWNIGLLGEMRIPTGRKEDFLGTGEVNARGLVIVSGLYSEFSPHANVGFEYRGSEFDQNELDLVVGFDHLLTPWATLAIDFLGSFKLGTSPLMFPEPVQITSPFPRSIRRTNIPDGQDDILDAAIGFKFRTGGGLVLIANTLISLNDGGLRSAIIPTFGLEYLF